MSLRRFLTQYAWVTYISFILYFLYAYAIQPANAYLRMSPPDVGFFWVALWFLWNAVTASFIPGEIRRPSDCLYLTYALFVLLTGAVTWCASGLLSPLGALLLLVLLSASLLLYRVLISGMTSLCNEFLPLVHFFRVPSYVFPLVALVLFGVLAGELSGQQGSFSMATSYVRRIAGRSHFPAGALISYVFAMVLNGVAPFAAFVAMYRRKVWLFALPVAFCLYAYWLIGTKEPVLLVTMMGYFGWYVRKKPHWMSITEQLVALVTVIFLVALLEYVVMGYSYIADYFIRRAFAVVGQLQAAYVAYAVHSFDLGDWLWGSAALKTTGAGMFIGNWYFHDPETNANTNTFLYVLLEGGLFRLVLSIAFVAAVNVLLDVIYGRRGTVEAVGLGFLYAILLTEQLYSTAFLSSGVAALLLLLMFLWVREEKRSVKTQ